MSEPQTIAGGATKAGVVWTGVFVGHTQFSLADIAAILASVYSALLIVGWFIDRFRGRRRRKRDDA